MKIASNIKLPSTRTNIDRGTRLKRKVVKNVEDERRPTVEGVHSDELLYAALEYHRRGWSIIPVEGKTPVRGLSWKKYQQRRATEDEIHRMFASPRATGIAVVLGRVSGGLCCRDFDTPDGYAAWASHQVELADMLPTVKTARGRHVYFLGALERTKHFKDGELRGEGSYCVLPPSRHPSGHRYSWDQPLTPGDVPQLDDIEAFEKNAQPHRFTQSSPSSLSGIFRFTRTVTDMVADLITHVLPNGRNQNHRSLFQLARGIKAIEDLKQQLSLAELRHAFDVWYGGNQFLRSSFSKDDYWFEFREALENVKFALNEGCLASALQVAKQSTLPVVADDYEDANLKMLVCLCRELQRQKGAEPFFISCRKVQSLFKHDSHQKSARWLKGLVNDGVLQVVKQGGADSMKATRYRYLLPLDQ
jgi:hypothetical protein